MRLKSLMNENQSFKHHTVTVKLKVFYHQPQRERSVPSFFGWLAMFRSSEDVRHVRLNALGNFHQQAFIIIENKSKINIPTSD